MNVGDKNGRCVYTRPTGLCCGDSELNDEHYLPRGLGNFRNYRSLKDMICERCNGRFSKLDEVLLNSGPEAIFRRIYGIQGRKKHRKTDPFHEFTHGRPPVEVVGRLPGDESTTRLEVLTGNQGKPRRELVFEWQSGKRIVLPVARKIDTPDKLREYLQKKQIKQDWSKCIVNGPADNVDFQKTVECCLGKIEPLGKAPDFNAHPATVPVASLIKLHPEYYRAIAKIGFHFFLWCSFPSISGIERSFDGIKEFIWRGGDPGKYIRSTAGPFERDQIGDAPYAHVLAAGIVDREALATVQLFAGSDSGINLVAMATDGRSFPIQMKNMSFAWIVKLGRSPFRIACDLRKALAFVAYKQPTAGFVGEVRELTPARSIIIWQPGSGPRLWA